MRLEPVYLVAPKPKPPSMTRRRALLGMGGCLVGGALLGGACGYSLGHPRAGDGPAVHGDGKDLPKPTGNPELDELRRLAVQAPIEELDAKFIAFFNTTTQKYSNDSILWSGIRRLAEHLLVNERASARRAKARLIARVIREENQPLDLSDLPPKLDTIK